MKASVERLRAEIKSDRESFSQRVAELRSIDLIAPSPAVLAQAAVALHHAYSAAKAALARASRFLEGSLPSGPDWHQALLHAMTLEVETVRPRILSDASATGLRKLLGFRHFFRHAYAVSWDATQLEGLRREAIALEAPLQRDLEGLDGFLKALAGSLG